MFSILNNSPSAGYIQWSSVNIQFSGVSYAIANGYTNYTYVYWLSSSPNQFIVSDTFPILAQSDVLVFLNKSGIAMVVPTATIMDGGLIVPGSIYAASIAANTITGNEIAAAAITSSELAANSVIAGKIAANAVTATTVAANAIGAEAIAAGAITADKIVASAITGDKIAAATITANKLVANTITAASGVMADAAITTAKIADANITNAKIANLAVDAAKIANATITTAKIANLAITTALIADANITTAKIANLAVTNAQIADATIASAKISSLDAGKVTTGILKSANNYSTINLADGTFNFGNGALAWNGSFLSATGKFISKGTTQEAQMDGGSIRLVNSGVDIGYFSIQTASPTGPYITVADAGTTLDLAKSYSGNLYSALTINWASPSSTQASYMDIYLNEIWVGNPTMGLIYKDGNLYATVGAGGKGLYVKDESTSKQWHIHMHGDSLKYYSADYGLEYEVIDTRNKGWYVPACDAGQNNQNITGGNIHSDYGTGFYMGSGVTNAYNSGWWHFIINRHNPAWRTIIAMPFDTGYVWWKAQRNGSWTGWMRINA